jgi:hypothetical protein
MTMAREPVLSANRGSIAEQSVGRAMQRRVAAVAGAGAGGPAALAALVAAARTGAGHDANPTRSWDPMALMASNSACFPAAGGCNKSGHVGGVWGLNTDCLLAFK